MMVCDRNHPEISYEGLCTICPICELIEEYQTKIEVLSEELSELKPKMKKRKKKSTIDFSKIRAK